jgi:hypothetical protein
MGATRGPQRHARHGPRKAESVWEDGIRPPPPAGSLGHAPRQTSSSAACGGCLRGLFVRGSFSVALFRTSQEPWGSQPVGPYGFYYIISCQSRLVSEVHKPPWLVWKPWPTGVGNGVGFRTPEGVRKFIGLGDRHHFREAIPWTGIVFRPALSELEKFPPPSQSARAMGLLLGWRARQGEPLLRAGMRRQRTLQPAFARLICTSSQRPVRPVRPSYVTYGGYITYIL